MAELNGNDCVIVGVGVTQQGRNLEIPERELRREAVELALADAGLKRPDVDGYIACHGGVAFEDLRYLGLGPLFSWSLSSGGATAISALIAARGVLAVGQASTVALCYGTVPSRFRGGGSGGGRGYGGFGYGYPELFDMVGPSTSHALHAQRHMHLYGTTSEQLGAVAVTQRAYASKRPGTLGYEKPITLEDHQTSRMICEPLRLLDCCRDTDGGVCVIVTTAERARDLRGTPVRVLGTGTGHNIRNWYDGSVYAHHDDIAPAKARAFAEAGIDVGDVDVAALYDPFTISVIMQLEEYGFCGTGEGGPFVAAGKTGPTGTIPTNTGGGQLSGYYATGFTAMVEGIHQLRGEGGATQVADAEIALVSGHGGNGGIQNTWAHATAVLGVGK
ncbi:MAG: thiolase family protein [Candidatus Binatia bacterium]|nr:thiolase family protein [Candidatus Binatia bacterium]